MTTSLRVVIIVVIVFRGLGTNGAINVKWKDIAFVVGVQITQGTVAKGCGILIRSIVVVDHVTKVTEGYQACTLYPLSLTFCYKSKDFFFPTRDIY